MLAGVPDRGRSPDNLSGFTSRANRNGSWISDPSAMHNFLPLTTKFRNRRYAVATADAETVAIDSSIIRI